MSHKKYKNDFVTPEDIISDGANIKSSQGIYGKLAEKAIFCMRKLRDR